MEEKQNTEILLILGRLEGTTTQGFKGIHQRQDITNGRIGKAESRLDALEKNDITRTEAFKALAKSDEAQSKATERDQLSRSKWFDRVLVIVFNAACFLIVLILVKTGIIKLN
jgi:hypothetical protein